MSLGHTLGVAFSGLAIAIAAYIMGVLAFAPDLVTEYHDFFGVLTGVGAALMALAAYLLHTYPNGTPAPVVQ